jgi:hypothetical protein
MAARPTPLPREKISTMAVFLAAAWVAAGALFKLFSGSPNDLPPQVRDVLGDSVRTFRVAIAIELCVVIFAVLRPRWGWIPLVALFLVFDLVLVPLVRAGASSCGCFGSRVPIKPVQMMAIDSSLLLLVLATRPWKSFARRALRPLPLVPLFAIAIAAPWYVFRTDEPTIQSRSGTPVAAVDEHAPDPGTTTESGGTESSSGTDEPESEVVWPDFRELHPDSWNGLVIQDVKELRRYLGNDALAQIPPDCRIVFFRQSCEHCKAHLEKLALEPPAEQLVLVRVPDPWDTPENEVTTIKPQALAILSFRGLERGYGGFTPPAEMTLRDFVVGDFHEVKDEEPEEGE